MKRVILPPDENAKEAEPKVKEWLQKIKAIKEAP